MGVVHLNNMALISLSLSLSLSGVPALPFGWSRGCDGEEEEWGD